MELKPPTEATLAGYLQIWSDLRAELLAFLEETGSRFQEKPADGSWSPSEIAEHLQLTQFFLARSVPIVLAGKFGMDMTGQASMDYKAAAGRFVRGAVKNPEVVTPSGSWDLSQARLKLAESMQRLEKSLKNRKEEELLRRGYQHPVQGPINLMEWLWASIQHEAMHLRILREKWV